MNDQSKRRPLAHASSTPVTDNFNIQTAGPRGPALLQDVWLIEKLAHFAREVIPERRMHAKGSGAHGTFTVTHDITRYTKAKILLQIGKQTPMFGRFSTVAGERGAADAERDIRGFALKFYTEEGNWDVVGNNTPVFFFRDPLGFPDLNHAIKRDPRTGNTSLRALIERKAPWRAEVLVFLKGIRASNHSYNGRSGFTSALHSNAVAARRGAAKLGLC